MPALRAARCAWSRPPAAHGRRRVPARGGASRSHSRRDAGSAAQDTSGHSCCATIACRRRFAGTTLTMKSIRSWSTPQSSAQRPMKVPVLVILLTSNSLTRPGITSRLKLNSMHPERVDDVRRRLHEQDAAVGRQDQHCGLPGTARDLRLLDLLAADVLLQVTERPVPPEADHLERSCRAWGCWSIFDLVTGRVVEEPTDDHERHDRVEDLDRQVVAHLLAAARRTSCGTRSRTRRSGPRRRRRR